MRPPSPENPPRQSGRRWLAALLLAAAPKCLLCFATYAGLGAAFGLGGVELCGARASDGSLWVAWLPGLGLIAGVTVAAWPLIHRRLPCPR